MPDGNLAGSATKRPSGPRSRSDQQSSMLTYWYPASLRPDETKNCAVSLMSFSFTSQPKAFQLLKPMGGVGASPSSFDAAGRLGGADDAEQAAASSPSASARRNRVSWFETDLVTRSF